MKLGVAGDTMLGRMVGERLTRVAPTEIVDRAVVEVAREADVFLLNLECAISDRGERWPDPDKPFFFRAPPVAVEVLRHLGVDVVTLANNHALDYGPVALLDTIRHLDEAGIAHAGAGHDEVSARTPAVVAHAGTRVGVVALTDHPHDFAARPDAPGVAFADLRFAHPRWPLDAIGSLDADVVVVSPHWGPNMVAEPLGYVRAAARTFLDVGADLVAGHSAHVFHGVAPRLLYDLGDFIDDYAVDPQLRNDRGLLWLVTFDGATPTRVEAVPLALDHCRTRIADADERRWIATRFRAACGALGTDVVESGDRLVVEW